MDVRTADAHSVDVGSDSRPAWSEICADEALCFHEYRLLPRARILLCDDQTVEIGSRAFDMLHLLLIRQGSVVERDVILHHVWPKTTVDESNLRSQVLRVRQVLGPYRDQLKTVPGRGYLLAADIASEVAARGSDEPLRHSAALGDPAGSRRSDTSESETLQALLRSVLDELRELRKVRERGKSMRRTAVK